MRKLMLYQILLVLGILVLSMTAAEEAAVLDAANSGDNLAREGLTLLQVTPQIPDGPVVRKFKKLDAKKRLDKQIVKQNKVLKPMLKRKKMKKKAVKNKMGMLADLAIKKRKTKEELRMKKKAKDDAKKRQSRKARAKKRRSERYEKSEHEILEMEKERRHKIGHSMKGAKKLTAKLKQAQINRSKEMSMKFTAKVKANNKEELKVGGLIHLKGKQINDKGLMDLNKKLAKANKYPTAHNIKMAQVVFNHAALQTAKEKERFDAAMRKRKTLEKMRKEKHTKNRNDRKDKKFKKIGELINKERRNKNQRQEKMRKSVANGREKNGKSWHEARTKVNRARWSVTRAERAAKNRFNAIARARMAEKRRKAPMEAYNKAKAVVKERGHKLMKAKKPARKFIAKTMKERAVKRMVEKGVKARVRTPARRRRINIRRRRAAVTSVRNSQVKLRHGICLDASQRNRSGGKVHLWPCNTRNWNQQWNYNARNGQIRNSHGICLDASQRNRNGGKVHMWGCNTRNYNQQWYYNHRNGMIKNRHGICLAVALSSQRKRAGARVMMFRCISGHADQSWTISGFRL